MNFPLRVVKKFAPRVYWSEGAFSTDNSFKSHLVFSLVALGAGLWLKPDLTGWALIVLAIGLVFVAELFNTAIEYLVRMFTTDYHELAAKLLDISAGAVVFAAFTALALAALVFLPLLVGGKPL